MFLDDKGRKLKERAEEAFLKQKWKKALPLYQSLNSDYEFDPRLCQRLGDVARRANEEKIALRAYKRIATYYIDEGYWAKALAMSKILVQLDPAEKQFLEQLAMRCSNSSASLDEEDTNPEQNLGKGESLNQTDFEVEGNSLGSPLGALEKVPLFSEMDATMLGQVLENLEHKEFKAGELICCEGENGDSMYLIADGQVEVVSQNDKKDTLVLATLRGGDFFGEYCMLSNHKRNASVIARTETELLVITKQDLDRIAVKHPKIWVVLQDYLKNRLVDTVMAKSEVFSVLTSEERLKLAEKMDEKTFTPGAMIVSEGSEGDDMIFIRSGTVAVTQVQDGSRVAIADLGAGDYFGEVAMLTGKPRTASVQAKSDCHVFALNRSEAATVFKQNVAILEKLKQVIDSRKQERQAIVSSYLEAKKSLALV